MGLITEKVTVKPSGKMIQYYKDLGYDAKWREELIVNIKDLPLNSKCQIEVKCDICNKIHKISFASYIFSTKNHTELYVCKDCKGYKNYYSYHNKTSEEIEQINQKRKNTFLERYSVENPSQSDSIRQKMISNNLEKYGVKYPSMTEEQIQRIKNSNLKKYGFVTPLLNDEIKEKIRKQNLELYGVENVFQSSEIQEKIRKTLYSNGKCPTSRPQKYIFDLYQSKYSQTELNLPIKGYSGDIVIDNLDIEINFGGHNLQVKLGDITQEEFDKREIIRNSIIKREGYKMMTIISRKDKLPSDEILLSMLEYTFQFFNSNPDRSWITFDIDNSCIYNAYHKEPNGLPFNFGELKTIRNNN